MSERHVEFGPEFELLAMLRYNSKRRMEIVLKPVPTRDNCLAGVLVRATRGRSIAFDPKALNQTPLLRRDLDAPEPLEHGTYLENKESI